MNPDFFKFADDDDDFPMSPTGNQSAQDFYESFLKYSEIISNIPPKELKKQGSNSYHQLFKEVRSTRSNNQALYRKRHDASESLSLLWFSRVKEIASMFIFMNPITEFKGIDTEQLSAIAKLSVDVGNLPKLTTYLYELGIVLVYERAIPGMKLDGAVYKSKSGHPVIALSLRYSRLDNFWFTLMHELAHVSLHFELLDTPILDDIDDERDENNLVELEADRLALNSFISRSDWRNSKVKYETNFDAKERALIDFAKQVNVHPAIVAGRFQKESGRHDVFSKIVNEVNVRKVLLGDD